MQAAVADLILHLRSEFPDAEIYPIVYPIVDAGAEFRYYEVRLSIKQFGSGYPAHYTLYRKERGSPPYFQGLYTLSEIIERIYSTLSE